MGTCFANQSAVLFYSMVWLDLVWNTVHLFQQPIILLAETNSDVTNILPCKQIVPCYLKERSVLSRTI